jgi:hypothetical protein
VVDEFRAKTHHRDTENTEVAQRNLGTRTFEAKQYEQKVKAVEERGETQTATEMKRILQAAKNAKP